MDKSTKIMLVAGARPNFMKIAPIIDAIKLYNSTIHDLPFTIHYKLIHTGQHYDELMSKLFFENLEIPKPDINLEVGSVSHAEQTAEIMKRFEPVLKRQRPHVVIVVGDVNSTMACSLVASKMVYPAPSTQHPAARTQKRPLVAHVEAGLRSFDRSMPEEINRELTDSIADFLFTTEESANENLRREGISEDKIHFVGNVMIDTLLRHKQKAEESKILHKLGLLNPKSEIQNAKSRNNHLPFTIHNSPITPYAVLTLHRPSNVDDRETFQGILEALSVIAKDISIIFPIHPRTLKRIHQFSFEQYFDFSIRNLKSEIRNKWIHCTDPLGYLDFLHLMADSKLVLTDSGGIQEETTILGVSCVTLRENTERPVTVTSGTNAVAGTKKENIISVASSQLQKLNGKTSSNNPQSAIRNLQLSAPPLWDGRAAERIVNILANSIL